MKRINWTCADNKIIAYDLEAYVHSVYTWYAKNALLIIKEDRRIYIVVISIMKDGFDIETGPRNRKYNRGL